MDMERLFSHGALFVHYLQERFWRQGTLFTWASYFGDPKYAYLLHFPILFAVSRKVGLQWLVAASLSECVNLVLKWILQEDRPYWWVHENASKVGNITLKQFPVTCESGPGSPSGHVMVITTVLYILINSLIEGKSIFLKILAWTVSLTVIFTVAASRMFLAAHFPHQCLLGFTVGLALGKSISKAKLTDLSSHNLLRAGFFCVFATFATYYGQIALGQDPNKSVILAIKWCIKHSYLHLDTTPLFASMRYIGVLLGTGLAVRNVSWKRYIDGNTPLISLASILLSLTACAAVLYCPLPSSNATAYAFNCTLHAALFIVLVRMIPEVLMWMFGVYGKGD